MNKIDILNRDKFIEQLLKLVENISANKVSSCFAINGVWGCGKTFVLDMFQEQLEQYYSEETCKEKYFVIRYNCWEFDYYEEPLVAIISAMMSIIEEKTKLFPDSPQRQEMLGILKAAGVTLLSIGSTALREKIGVDIQQAYDIVRNGKKDGAANYENEQAYDTYFGLNKIMDKLKDFLQNLASEHTIVFLVDELDRCLPEYAVKVLERLHHLTDGRSGIITIISIDKDQLQSSVKRIFGFDNPAKYLEKFINFEVKLDYGIVSETISEKYADYIALFDRDIFPFDDSVEECLQAIFKNIDIRTQEQLVKKAMLAHKLLYSGMKDYSFMCMELLLIVMICVYHDESCFSDKPLLLLSFGKIFMVKDTNTLPAFAGFFQEKFENLPLILQQGWDDETIYLLPERASLYGAIIFIWYWMHAKNVHASFQYIAGSIYEAISNSSKELKKYIEMIKFLS